MNTGKSAELPVPPEEFDLIRDLRHEVQNHQAKAEEEVREREREWGKQTSDCMRQNHEGGGFWKASGQRSDKWCLVHLQKRPLTPA